MIVYDPFHRNMRGLLEIQAPHVPTALSLRLSGRSRVAMRSFGSDCPVVIRSTGAGPGRDPHPSPTEAHGLLWLGS